MAIDEPRDEPVRVGISACLLGQKVRYDGGHKQDHFLSQTLGRIVRWVGVCPEVELGLGVPRPTLQLQRHGRGVRLVMPSQGEDLTGPMRAYARRRVAELAGQGLAGYVFKKGSPSCGVWRVRVHGSGGEPRADGRGLFAEALLRRIAHLPIEEEERLHDPRLRENWLGRVFAYRRLASLWRPSWKRQDLAAFHAAHRLLLLAHSPGDLRQLDRLLAEAGQMPLRTLRAEYQARFFHALGKRATVAKNTGVLRHALRLLGRDLDTAARSELTARIDDYRRGRAPLIVPLTLVAHYARLLAVKPLDSQVRLSTWFPTIRR